jgi:hypothetical protein
MATTVLPVHTVQADMHHVAIPQLESNIRAAFRQRGVSVHPSLSIRAEIEADCHFIKEQRSSDGETMVWHRSFRRQRMHHGEPAAEPSSLHLCNVLGMPWFKLAM